MKRIAAVILVLTVGMVLFAGCGGGSTQQSNKPAENVGQTVKGKMGEVLSLSGDTQITVKRVVRNPEDNKMILAEVEIKNIGDVPKVYSLQNFVLRDENGKIYLPEIARVPNPIITTNVLPGKTLEGFVGFSVPDGENKFTLVFQGATGTINVEITVPKQ